MSAYGAMTPGSVSDLARRLLLARADEGDEVNPCGRAVFWIGAGASVSAGIPSGRALAGLLAVRLARKLGHFGAAGDDADPDVQKAAFAALQANGEIGEHYTLGTAYGELFARLDAAHQRDFVRRVILRTNRRQNNWTHLALGELVRQRIVHTVLTTNFDDLLHDGLVRCDQLPAIVDGVESLNRLDPRPPVPQLVYLHGSQHTYSPRNSTKALLATKDFAQVNGGLYSLLQHCAVLTVVGYAGNAGEGVMEMLVRVCQILPELPIYWVAYGQQDELSPQARQLLAQGAQGHLIAGQDSDLFFRQLLRDARIGVPSWFRDPVEHLVRLAERIRVEPAAESAALEEEVADFRDRLRQLAPAWVAAGAANQERRELRQLLLSDQHAALWDRLSSRVLEDVGLLQMRAEAAYELGRRGTRDVLPEAVRDWAQVLRARPAGSDAWALAQMRFGDCLATLGEHGDPRAVRDAIAAYGRALEVRTREARPLEWASTRNNQGLAFLTLAEWGLDDAGELDAALDAFRDALGVYAREATPAEWAATTCNLANALQILGVRERDGARLAEAVAAYGESLEIYAGEKTQRDWALAACDRAAARLALGRQTGDRSLLERAAQEFEQVVGMISREATPIDWALARNHQGLALLALGQTGDEGALRRGIEVLREALVTQPREAAPGHWVAASHHLGSALLALGRRGDSAALTEAMDTLGEALALLNGELYPAVRQLDIESLAQRVFNELRRLAANRQPGLPGLAPAAARTIDPRCRQCTRVLVVEDDPVHQLRIGGLLEACFRALELRTCRDGASAVADLESFRPDLVVLDLGLPDMDGREVLAAARRILPTLPVLIYSAATAELDEIARERGGDDPAIAVLDKNSAREAFVRVVPSLFKRRNGDRAEVPAPAAARGAGIAA